MNIKFLKITCVEYMSKTGEIGDKTFYQNEVLKGVTVEPLSQNYSDIQFPNGELALNVPNNTFKEVN